MDPTNERIVSARITDGPQSVEDLSPESVSAPEEEMPWVIVTTESGQEIKLFWFYPDELTFEPRTLLG